MKTKKILCSLLLAAVCGGAAAQRVTVDDVEALPGETVSFSLSLAEGKADTYTSLQFNILFPTTGFSTADMYTISPLWPGASAVVGDVDGDGLAIVPVSSADAIVGTEVLNLLTVSFTIGADVALGDYDVTLSRITFGYGFTDKDVADDATFTVHVVSAHNVVLDENSTELPAKAEGVNVVVRRTLKADEWSTICLPFAMTAAQMADAFGNDVQLAEFVDHDYDEATDALSVNFANATAIKPNHPYIIKVAEDVSQFAVTGVDVYPQEDEAYVENDNGRTGSRRVVNSGFYGTLRAGEVVPELCLFLSDNKFWYSIGQTRIKAFRAYFEFIDVLREVDQAYGSRISLSVDDATAGIKTQRTTTAEQLFDLYGRPVRHPANGLYIRNGRKEIVK